MFTKGKLIISLDFELLWGVRDRRTIASYGENIRGVWEVLPRMLQLFDQYDIKATFATVGLLFAANKEELMHFCPAQRPNYSDQSLSPYNGHFKLVKENEQEDPYHFAPTMIQFILDQQKHEIASHTFSHYYCLEKGQTPEAFKADLQAALAIAKAKGISIQSLVFPRNQYNDAYLKIAQELGLTTFRGNEKKWFYRPSSRAEEPLHKRAFRLLDAYLNLSGPNCYGWEELSGQTLINIPSSRFLRPYSPGLKYFDYLRIKRIMAGMSYAAKQHKVYHLWWHPHNFGKYQNENFAVLHQILEHYRLLNEQFSFESCTMKTLTDLLKQEHE